MTPTDHAPTDPAVAQQIPTDAPPAKSYTVGTGALSRLRHQLIENPLLSLYGAIIVVLLGFVLTTANIRITETNERITRLDNRIDERFNRSESRIDDRFNQIDDRFNQIDDRFNRIEDQIIRNNSAIDDRLNRFEARVEDRFVRIESRIGSLEGAVAEIDRKLTALIAALGQTDEVEGALSGDADVTQTPTPIDEAAEYLMYLSPNPHPIV